MKMNKTIRIDKDETCRKLRMTKESSNQKKRRESKRKIQQEERKGEGKRERKSGGESFRFRFLLLL